jgi:hypothetical protein
MCLLNLCSVVLTCSSRRQCVTASGIQHSGSTLLVLLALLVLLLVLFFGLLPALFSLCLHPAVLALAVRILGANRSLQSSTQILTPYTSLSTLSSVCPGRNAPSLCCLLTGSALGLSAHNILQTQNHLTTTCTITWTVSFSSCYALETSLLHTVRNLHGQSIPHTTTFCMPFAAHFLS